MNDTQIAVSPSLFLDLFPELKNPSASIVYLFLWVYTHGRGTSGGQFSHQMIADGCGLSKSTVQKSIRFLISVGLIQSARVSPTAIPEYQILWPWPISDEAEEGGDLLRPFSAAFEAPNTRSAGRRSGNSTI